MEYAILKDGKSVGKAFVTEHGLYMEVLCICRRSNGIERVVAICESGEENIGICAPAGGQMEVTAKIPKKRLRNIREFCMKPVDKDKKWLPLIEGQPVQHLEAVLCGKLKVREGTVGVEISFNPPLHNP